MTVSPDAEESSPRAGAYRVGSQARAGPLAADEPSAPRWLDAVLDEAILRCDHVGRVVETFGPPDLLPVAARSLAGLRVSDIEALPAAMRQAWATALDRTLDTQRPQIAAYRLERDEGPRSYEARMMPTAGTVTVVIRDVGERDLLRGRLAHLALHDPVTGLSNVRALRERLGTWLRPGADVAVVQTVLLLVVDLDRFKQANDLHGRSVGDTLLRLVAQRLSRETAAEIEGRPYDAHEAALFGTGFVDDPDRASRVMVARLGGDQFGIAWRLDDRSTSARDAADAAAGSLANRLITALGAPTRIAGQPLFVRSSIGVSAYPHDAQDASTLLSQAEAALRRAKQAGRNQYRRHGDDEAGSAALRPPATEAALRAALGAGEFLVVYQPKFELASSLSMREDGAGADGPFERPADRAALAPGAMIAVEALVRWRTPAGALLVPQDFLPLAESSGMIRPLGDWVLRTALSEVARFASQGGARVGVAINVSLLQLHDRLFVETVAATLDAFGFAPSELTIEIAETAFVDDVRLVADAVAELSSLGVRVAIDHFGAGTAGLVALKMLPVDEIKIDRGFVAGAAVDAFDATIVAGLVEMAHNLGMMVTADGVERIDQIAALNQLRCDAIQGYFIGEPMTAADLVAAASLWRRTRGGTAG